MKTKCHFISNTHWDREWKFSAKRTQHMLVEAVDMLLDIFEKEPEYKHFHLDSQTLPLQDYLDIRPEKRAALEKYISEGRLAVGPWFCLPDEFCVGGESLVRNLLLGHKMANEFGKVSKTGYSPFGWGQISQMPQLYSGFGINFSSFYRGINTYAAPRSEFYWEGADGTVIYASRLGQRPRYNVWYILQRPVFYGKENGDDRRVSWGAGDGIFRMADPSRCEYEYRYAHRKYEYHDEFIKEKTYQALREQDGDWSTAHRFWSNGHDSSIPDIREARMIRDANNVDADVDVFHGSVYDFEQSVISSFDKNSPTLKGEMRYPFTKGSVSALFGWILSARIKVKQDNFNTERLLTHYAEPMAVYAALCGAVYPQAFIDKAYNYMLQNHGHDSIGACGRDVVYKDVEYRFRQSAELAACVLERAMTEVAGDIKFDGWDKNDMALVMFNPACFTRSAVVPCELEIPLEWECDDFEIYDTDGNECPLQKLSSISPMYQIVQDPADAVDVLPVSRHSVRVFVKDIPPMGYKTLKVIPKYNTRAKNPQTMLTAPYTMENEYLIVSINHDATLKVTDKETGRVYNNIGYFKDTGEAGSPWEHKAPETDSVYTTIGEKAHISLVYTGALETRYKAVIDWAIPETSDEKRRSERLKPYRIEMFITLRKGEKWVEFETNIDNQVPNHYLQAAFPTSINAEYVYAQGQFDIVKRAVKRPDYSRYDEIPMTEQPMNSFVDICTESEGASILNTGLKAYEAGDDAENTMYISLLRCFELRIYVTPEEQNYARIEDGSQSYGAHKFRYAFMPHSGSCETAHVWKESERFNKEILIGQLGPTHHGKNPFVKSFAELKNESLYISAVKRSEDNAGWAVRLFNPSSETVSDGLRFNGGMRGAEISGTPVERRVAEYELPEPGGEPWSRITEVTLEEKEIKELCADDDGYVYLELSPKKICTIKFTE